jgi:hypothetical protein
VLWCPRIWIGEKGGVSGEKIGGVVVVVGGGVTQFVVGGVDPGDMRGRQRP